MAKKTATAASPNRKPTPTQTIAELAKDLARSEHSRGVAEGQLMERKRQELRPAVNPTLASTPPLQPQPVVRPASTSQPQSAARPAPAPAAAASQSPPAAAPQSAATQSGGPATAAPPPHPAPQPQAAAPLPQTAPAPQPAAPVAAPQPQPAPGQRTSTPTSSTNLKSGWQNFRVGVEIAAAILLFIGGMYILATWNKPESAGLTKADMTAAVRDGTADLRTKIDTAIESVGKVSARQDQMQKGLDTLAGRVQKLEESKSSTPEAPAKDERPASSRDTLVLDYTGDEKAWQKYDASAKYDAIADACAKGDYTTWKHTTEQTALDRIETIRMRKLSLADARKFVESGCDPRSLEPQSAQAGPEDTTPPRRDARDGQNERHCEVEGTVYVPGLRRCVPTLAENRRAM